VVIPSEYHKLARIIHQERIQAAQTRQPDWVYEEALLARPKQHSSSIQRLRRWLAQLILAPQLPDPAARPTETRLRADSQ
jgi:hypothetical protein